MEELKFRYIKIISAETGNRLTTKDVDKIPYLGSYLCFGKYILMEYYKRKKKR